ncbi:MAG: hypothetical protein ACI8PZ_002181 [Myxococcota bacterium]
MRPRHPTLWLLVAGCLADPAAPLLLGPDRVDAPALPGHAPPPGELQLDVSATVIGAPMVFSVTGAFPWETVVIATARGGLGDGPCIPELGGRCLELLAPARILTRVSADEWGEAEVWAVVPDLPGVLQCFQPMAVRGHGGADSELGAASCRTFDHDRDGDGVVDADDPCPDDLLDDSDGDGVCDADDLCPGGDDTLDPDGDGVPDVCDACPDDPLDGCVDPLAELQLVSVVGNAGDITAACPPDTSIAFGFGIQTSTDHAGEGCLKANSQACVQGEASCSMDYCDTAGDDESVLVLGCAPSLRHWDDAEFVFVQGDAGGIEATCSGDDSIVLGFAYQWSDGHSGEACLKANNLACEAGTTTCSQERCDTPGNDESLIYMVCAPPGSPLAALAITTAQGNAGGIEATCPPGELAALGWSLQTSSAHSGDACLKANNGACPRGVSSCAMGACDTAGDDESFIYLGCLP